MRARTSGPHLPRPGRGLLSPLLVVAMAIAGLFTVVAPASAATSVLGSSLPNVTRLSNNALRLDYNGHSYICYYGDLCMYRGGRYEAYYACQTVSNSASATGWVINNQYGAGGTARFYGRAGYVSYQDLAPSAKAVYAYWSRIAKFRVCT